MRDKILLQYRDLYDVVLIEDQPYISSNSAAQSQLANFKLQLIDISLRGLVIGFKKPVEAVRPVDARKAFGLCSGDYDTNKKLSYEFCKTMGFYFTNVPAAKRHHIADTVVNTCYYLRANFSNLCLPDACHKSPNAFRAVGKKRKGPDPKSLSRQSEAPKEGSKQEEGSQ